MLDSDLLVVPSTWPEPFGLIGPEAGLHRLPAAAFAVGGIPEWLSDGVNGRLAPGDPPSAAGLARAIVECVRDPAELARLRNGAREHPYTAPITPKNAIATFCNEMQRFRGRLIKICSNLKRSGAGRDANGDAAA